jgi:hypothetical protein
MDKKEFLKNWQAAGKEELAAQITPETINQDNRSVDVVWFTGADVERYNWMTGQSYTLRFDPKGVDLSLLNNGAPVLDNHWLMGTEDQKGVVDKAWTQDKQYMGTLRFSRRPEVDGLWQDITDKIVSKFSMGVQILQFEDSQPKKGEQMLRLATKWQPFEISIAPLPADFGTTTLSAVEASEPATATEPTGAIAHKEHSMEETAKTVAAEAPAPEPVIKAAAEPRIDVEALKAEAATTERLRIKAINDRARTAKLSQAFADALASDANVTVEEATTRIFAELAKVSAAQPETHSHIAITRDEGDTRRQAMSAALLNKYDMQQFPLKDGLGRNHMNQTLMEMAKACLAAKGTNCESLSRPDIARLAISDSDLPNIVLDVANKTLRQAYETAPRTFTPFSRQASAPDFKNINRIQLSEMPQLAKVNPGGEFTYGGITDSKETYKLGTYGKIVNINRQTIINDDMSAFTRIPAGFGVAAATLESDTVYSIITANAALADAITLFHASHNNSLTGAGTALSVAAIGAALAKLAQQTGLDGKTLLSIMGRYLVVPVTLQLTATQIVSTALVPAQTTNAVPDYIRQLQVIADPRLDVNSTTAWYLAAAPAQVDTIEYCYLEGSNGVYMEHRMGFEVDGIEIKARLDFAAKAIDFRGLQKNAGA